MTKPIFIPQQEDIEKQVCLRESLKQSELTVKKLQEENKYFCSILTDIKKEKEKLQSNRRWIESELDHKDFIINEKEIQLEKLQEENEEFKNKLKGYNEDVKELQKTVARLQSEKTDADHALTLLHSIMDAGLKVKLDEANSQLNTIKLELNSAMTFLRNNQTIFSSNPEYLAKANQEIVQKLAELISSVEMNYDDWVKETRGEILWLKDKE